MKPKDYRGLVYGQQIRGSIMNILFNIFKPHIITPEARYFDCTFENLYKKNFHKL